jgi:hypothetical protein
VLYLQIFGPVLAVGKFKTEAEAIALANDTTYGLGAGLHSSGFFFPLHSRLRGEGCVSDFLFFR